MFRLTLSGLPVTPSNYKLAPLARLWIEGKRGMGIQCKINVFAYEDSDISEILPTPEPIYQGQLIKCPLPFSTVESVLGFTACSEPANVKPFQYWLGNDNLYLYVTDSIPTSIIATAKLVSRITDRPSFVYEFQSDSTIDRIPSSSGNDFVKSLDTVLTSGEFEQIGQLVAIAASTPTTMVGGIEVVEEDWLYVVSVPENFTVTKVNSLGLEFLPSTEFYRPNPGEFKQDGTTVLVCGSPQFHLELGQEIESRGTIVLPAPAKAFDAATFYLPSVTYLEKIEWKGFSFVAVTDVFDPKINEFFWDNNGYATVFF